MNKYPPHKKKEVLAMFKKVHGHIGETCLLCDIDRQTFTSWTKNDPEFARGIKDIKQSWIDAAEVVIRQAIEEDDVDTSKWVLSRLGRDRGYGDKQEIEHKGIERPTIQIILDRQAPAAPNMIDIPHQEIPPTALPESTD